MPARTIYLIKRLETEVTTRMIQALSAYDITPAQYVILSFVGTSETDLSSAQLSRRFLMTPQSMNEVVTTLQRKALLEKNTDPNHRRILRLSLTDKGKETLDLCDASLNQLETDLLSGFSVSELKIFRILIARILGKGEVL